MHFGSCRLKTENPPSDPLTLFYVITAVDVCEFAPLSLTHQLKPAGTGSTFPIMLHLVPQITIFYYISHRFCWKSNYFNWIMIKQNFFFNELSSIFTVGTVAESVV